MHKFYCHCHWFRSIWFVWVYEFEIVLIIPILLFFSTLKMMCFVKIHTLFIAWMTIESVLLILNMNRFDWDSQSFRDPDNLHDTYLRDEKQKRTNKKSNKLKNTQFASALAVMHIIEYEQKASDKYKCNCSYAHLDVYEKGRRVSLRSA